VKRSDSLDWTGLDQHFKGANPFPVAGLQGSDSLPTTNTFPHKMQIIKLLNTTNSDIHTLDLISSTNKKSRKLVKSAILLVLSIIYCWTTLCMGVARGQEAMPPIVD